jgi:hypothetical protein
LGNPLSFADWCDATTFPELTGTGAWVAHLHNCEQNFQEEIPLKLKTLAVITLLVLGCSTAFAGTFSLGFLSYDGSVQYCDYETISVSAPYAAGIHNLTTGCGSLADAAQVGFLTTIPRPTSAPVSGAVIALADSTFDAEYQSVTGCQIDWVTKRKPSKNWGWSFYYTCGGGSDYLGNWGYLTTQLGPAHNGVNKTSFGAVKANLKRKQ